MNWLTKQCQSDSSFRKLLYSLFFLAALLHLAPVFVGHFYADDFVQRAYAIGSPTLAEKGLLDGIQPNNAASFITNQFNFFDPKTDNYQAMKNFGMMPWWSEDNIKLHFFRPLASLTHYIEYQLYPDNPRLMHLVDVLWYLFGIAAIYLLYRGLKLPRSLALLALLIFILTINMFHVVTWIASRSMLMVIAIGAFCLYSYHRSLQEKWWYAIALISLVLCLLSAEASLAICAYLAAYFFTLDSRPWLQRIQHILPFALIALFWLIAYQFAGFGAKGGDFYVDPGADLGYFLQHALSRLPASFFELASGTALLSGQIRPDIRTLHLALVGVASLFAIIYLLMPTIKQNKTLQFCLLGSVLALIPGLTIVLSPRVMVLPSIGFSVVLAYLLLHKALGLRLWLLRLSKVYIVIFHIIAALIIAAIMNYQSIHNALTRNQPHGFVDLGVTDFADKHIIAVNTQQPFWLAFIAHQLDYNQQALPQSLRLLTSSFYPLTLQRTSENSFILQGLPALQLDRKSLDSLEDKPAGHYIYLTWQLMGLIRSERETWHIDQQFDFSELSIRVIALEQGKPEKLLITLHKPLSEYRWIYQDIKEQQYRPLILPEVGESIHFEGVFAND